jgi:hypothetical protein
MNYCLEANRSSRSESRSSIKSPMKMHLRFQIFNTLMTLGRFNVPVASDGATQSKNASSCSVIKSMYACAASWPSEADVTDVGVVAAVDNTLWQCCAMASRRNHTLIRSWMEDAVQWSSMHPNMASASGARDRANPHNLCMDCWDAFSRFFSKSTHCIRTSNGSKSNGDSIGLSIDAAVCQSTNRLNPHRTTDGLKFSLPKHSFFGYRQVHDFIIA